MRSLVRSPLGVVGAYLALTLPLLVLGSVRGGGAGLWAVLVLHAAATWAALGATLGRKVGDVGSSLLGLAAIPLLYAEVPWLNQALVQGYHDPLVLAWERALTGFDPSRELAAILPWTWLSELLHLSYLTFYPGIYLPPLLLAWRGRHHAFATTTLGILLAGVVCYLAFALFPVQGPRYFGPPEGVPQGPVRVLVLLILETGSSRGAAFPSAHMALMAAQSVLGFRFQRGVGLLVSVATVGVGVGAVYGGFHYAVDMAAGALVGVGSAVLALRLRRNAGDASPA